MTDEERSMKLLGSVPPSGQVVSLENQNSNTSIPLRQMVLLPNDRSVPYKLFIIQMIWSWVKPRRFIKPGSKFKCVYFMLDKWESALVYHTLHGPVMEWTGVSGLKSTIEDPWVIILRKLNIWTLHSCHNKHGTVSLCQLHSGADVCNGLGREWPASARICSDTEVLEGY